MRASVQLCTAGLGFALVACGSLEPNTGSAPALATLKGSLTNPQSLDIAGSVRVAVVWRTGQEGEFNVAEDLPVQPVFPSAFTIQFNGPPPANAMNSGSLLSGSSSSSGAPSGASGGSAGSPGSGPPPPSADASAPSGGATPQNTPVTPSADFQFAVGSVVAYLDQNGNGKLDLVPSGASAYVDRIVASNQDMAVAYFQGPVPPGHPLVDAFGQLPTDGYNLATFPYCNVPLNQPSNPKCTTVPPIPESCNVKMQWLGMSTPYTLTVASSPEVSMLMCASNNGGSSTTAVGSAGPAGPPDPKVQPAVYPSPCDPHLSCSSDGSEYYYGTCTTISEGVCQGTVTNCTTAYYARPTPAPAGWPCLD